MYRVGLCIVLPQAFRLTRCPAVPVNVAFAFSPADVVVSVYGVPSSVITVVDACAAGTTARIANAATTTALAGVMRRMSVRGDTGTFPVVSWGVCKQIGRASCRE